jgi:potassium/hydrogen antiporter
VVLSVLLQGLTIPTVARLLGVDEAQRTALRYPIEFEQMADMDSDLVEIVVPPGSSVVDKKILELGLPDAALVVLVSRDDQFIVPRGATTLLDGDRLLLLADEASLEEVRRIVGVQERRAVARSE